MLAGHPPYRAGDPFAVALMHVTHPVPQLPEPYAWLQPLITTLMAKDPAERFSSGAATVEAIHRLLATAPEAASVHQSSPRKVAVGNRLSGATTQQRTKLRLAEGFEPRAWLLPAAIVGVLALAVAAWAFWPSAETGQVAAMPSATSPSNSDGADSSGETLSATFPAQPSGLPMAADEIENALRQADNYLATGTAPESGGRHLIYPDDDSALYLYQRVLTAQPENIRARKGIAALVSYYRRYAHLACQKEQWGNCAVIAGLGLQIDPSDAAAGPDKCRGRARPAWRAAGPAGVAGRIIALEPGRLDAAQQDDGDVVRAAAVERRGNQMVDAFLRATDRSGQARPQWRRRPLPRSGRRCTAGSGSPAAARRKLFRP